MPPVIKTIPKKNRTERQKPSKLLWPKTLERNKSLAWDGLIFRHYPDNYG